VITDILSPSVDSHLPRSVLVCDACRHRAYNTAWYALVWRTAARRSSQLLVSRTSITLAATRMQCFE
jgi:hypothetical protein